MIATVSLNPSLDYIVQVNNFTLGSLNRTHKELILPGGKGTNVSIVLKNVGSPTKAYGFCAGFTGKELKRLLQEEHVDQSFITVKEGITRINIKIQGKEETELNGMGPLITPADIEHLYTQLDALTPQDILVLAGSIPTTLPSHIYKDIMEKLKEKQMKVVVDTTKERLLQVLPLHPFLIKPNIVELEELFKISIQREEEIITYAQKLQEMGAVNVLVSRGKDGALLIDEHQHIHSAPAVGGKVVNSVGAGDSMVAGFLHGYLMHNEYEEAFKMGLCAGGASACSTYLATKEEIERLYQSLSQKRRGFRKR